MGLYRKKQVEVEAFRWTGGPDQTEDPVWIVEAIKAGRVSFQGGPEPHMMIETLEGDLRASVGDWIIRGVTGEIYPIKPDIFEMTYERVS